MYYPPLVPTVVFTIVRGLPLPPPLDVRGVNTTLVLPIVQANNIGSFNNIFGVRTQVKIETEWGSAMRGPHILTTLYIHHRYHRQPSQEMVTLASIQVWPGSWPATTHEEVVRYSDPHQITH